MTLGRNVFGAKRLRGETSSGAKRGGRAGACDQRQVQISTLYPYLDHQQPVCLKRPVSRRGSILLGELVAILITLEHMVQHLATMPCSLLKIFSDSQSTVGIITLNWKDTSYRSITRDIRNAISIL